ncbi:polyphosphate kinase [Caballeronia pedi]|uniref:ADP/GDP-polyphosphate phosphotransferase n=1 Tax=Caballeronia pedi TaxID=1777141 RepID=A0A158E0E9_9BURK|nr:polyphosphate kinase [Caballeronia pedi]
MHERLNRKQFEKELVRLHVGRVRLQEWAVYTGAKIYFVFEGRDGAGNGGTIKAITERVSPRIVRVIALPTLPAPTEREKSQMYVQRYLPHLPATGQITLFHRSWYNRAGIERVMGFRTDEQAATFLKGVPLVERAIIESGIILLKYWLEVGQQEQTRRLEERIHDERKIWKLSPMALRSYSRCYDYSRAREDMFDATDTDLAPWYVVRSDDKRRARLNLISDLLANIPYKAVPLEKVNLPTRQKAEGYRESDRPLRYVPERSERDIGARISICSLRETMGARIRETSGAGRRRAMRHRRTSTHLKQRPPHPGARRRGKLRPRCLWLDESTRRERSTSTRSA